MMKETIDRVGVILLEHVLSKVNTGFPNDAASVTFTRPQSRLVLVKFNLNSLVIRIITFMCSLRLRLFSFTAVLGLGI